MSGGKDRDIGARLKYLSYLKLTQQTAGKEGIKTNLTALIRQEERNLGIRARFDVERNTHIINFLTEKSFTDPIVADGCIVVLTSGLQGTLSHLTPDSDPELFASDLQTLIGRSGVPTILSGGLDSMPTSVQLAEGLKHHLQLAGFVLNDNSMDILGEGRRKAILFQDKVFIEKTFRTGEIVTSEISFPTNV
jgi:hypothetical protein